MEMYSKGLAVSKTNQETLSSAPSDNIFKFPD